MPTKKEILQALEYRRKFQNLILKISSRFMNLSAEEIDLGIGEVLGLMGEFEGADRSYLFQFEEDGMTFSNTHEWCRPGIPPMIDQLKKLTLHDLPWIMEKVTRGETVRILRVAGLPFEASAEKREFQREGILSLVTVPVLLAGKVVGFLGLDMVRVEKVWTEDSIALLKIVAEIFAGALERRRVERALHKSKAELEERVASRTTELEELNRRLKEVLLLQSQEIARRKKTEEALRRSEEKYREFVSTVTHELRAPLTAILASLNAMERFYNAAANEDLRTLIEIARNNSTRLDRLISDVLDLEKMESGGLDFRMQTVSLMPLIEQAVQANRGYARKYKVDLLITERADAVVSVDPDRLIQVITNLLSNAVKYSPEHEQVHIAVSQNGSGVRVAVEDKGPGIPEEFRPKIFHKFLRGDSRKEGTGLGLSISKTIMDKLNGSIGFEVRQNAGTTFFIELPVMKA